MVITCALHAQGPRFEPGRDQAVRFETETDLLPVPLFYDPRETKVTPQPSVTN